MKSLVYHGPWNVRVEDRPIPELKGPKDVIIKTTSAALCGSELHAFRGHQDRAPGYICGHEGAGIIVQVGADVKRFKKGDYVVSPFTATCGECFYCRHSLSSRCVIGELSGSPDLDGSQAEYFRIPLADTTLELAPAELGEEVILMADIYPTGFNGAKNAFQAFHKEFHADMVVVVIGCGPVALCSIAAALEFKPRLIYAVDSVPARLERAKALGAIPVDFKTQDVKQEILSVTDGRGADAVIEVVGHPDALRTAYDIVRLGGKISVIGLHTRPLPFTGDEAYQKNIHIQFGRCPVRSVFNDALASLVRNKDKFKGFVDVTLSGIDQRCVDALHRFEKNEHFKVVIKPSGQDVTVDWTS